MPDKTMQAQLVYCTCPDETCAERIAAALLGARLAACVHLLPAGRSLYHWQGQLQQEPEITLLIKSAPACYPALEKLILSLHPYELPEIIATPITQGLPDYLNWIRAYTENESV